MSKLPVTIVIPTHKRHALLSKTLKYYGGFGVAVLVVDSSPEPYAEQAGLCGAEYLHVPNEPLPHKLRAPVMDRVKTPFMFFSADDMFMSRATVEHCLAFLNANPDYASAQGLYFGVPMDGNRAGLRALYITADNYDNTIDAGAPEERMLQLFCRYVPTFYAVYRTACWQQQMERYPDVIRNYCLFEFFFAMATAISGKHKILPETYAITYMAPAVNGLDPSYRNDLHELATLGRYAEEYAAFEDAVVSLLLANSKRSEGHARLFLRKAVAMQAWNRKALLSTGEKLRRECAKLKVKLFDSKGLKARRQARREHERLAIEQEYRQLRQYVGPQGEALLEDLLRVVEPRAAAAGKSE